MEPDFHEAIGRGIARGVDLHHRQTPGFEYRIGAREH